MCLFKLNLLPRTKQGKKLCIRILILIINLDNPTNCNNKSVPYLHQKGANWISKMMIFLCFSDDAAHLIRSK